MINIDQSLVYLTENIHRIKEKFYIQTQKKRNRNVQNLINMPDGHIQKHLHSMFQLLRSEETLKMVNTIDFN